MNDNRDALDYGAMRIPRLFRKLFFPTLLGLVSGVLLNLADGIFVGRGVGSDALAAINIAAPMFQVAAGIALMFGSGMSVVAAIHLSHGNRKAANINVTQAFTVGLLLMALVVAVINVFPRQTTTLLGGSESLYPMVHDYLMGVSPCLLFFVVEMVGLFAIRLDGSPKYAMMLNVLAAALNIVLDWVFVFPLQMGVLGAAIATSLSAFLGAALVVAYFVRYNRQLHLYRPKFSHTALRLTLRNCGYMLRLGLPTFIAETAICCMMVSGNFVFMRYLHEDGVAAFSVACYLFPMIFMFGNSIAQSSLPIVSYNYGLGNHARIRETLRLSVVLASGLGVLMSVLGFVLGPAVVDLFIDRSSAANAIGSQGMPLFLLVCLPFTLNVVLIGYLQSMERYRLATVFMLLRGFIIIVPCFVLLPEVMSVAGLWLAEPLSETLTLLSLLGYLAYSKWKSRATNGSSR